MSSSALTTATPDLSSGVFTETTSRSVAVSVRGMSKSYTIAKNAAQHTTAGEALMHKLKNPFAKVERDTFWALKDVSFDIQQGDVVGIIGRNGAGKSTLLKILSRITSPTAGEIALYGRVGSLLEVGTGFHPELTGRENIFLNGAILGMQKSEIARQFDAIVEFSGTAQFLDTPVKRYSSGMYVRLAFAVAAHLNPEILIVDEVLAVGDSEFQKKCLGKMQDVAKSGRTVLFVSHNMGAVRELCSQAILMSKGRLLNHDRSDKIIRGYLEDSQSDRLEAVTEADPDLHPEAAITRCRLTDAEGHLLKSIDVRYGFSVELEAEVYQNTPGVEVTIRINTSLGQSLLAANLSDTQGQRVDLKTGLNCFSMDVPGCFLAPGVYSLTVGLHIPNIRTLHNIEHMISFDIEETGSNMWQYSHTHVGDILVRFPWRHEMRERRESL